MVIPENVIGEFGFFGEATGGFMSNGNGFKPPKSGVTDEYDQLLDGLSESAANNSDPYDLEKYLDPVDETGRTPSITDHFEPQTIPPTFEEYLRQQDPVGLWSTQRERIEEFRAEHQRLVSSVVLTDGEVEVEGLNFDGIVEPLPDLTEYAVAQENAASDGASHRPKKKRKKIDLSSASSGAWKYTQEDAATISSLRERLAAHFPGYDLEDYVTWLLERITEHPLAANYVEPEAFFDERLPQTFHTHIVNRFQKSVVAAEINGPNVKADIRDTLISAIAYDSGYENGAGEIVNPDKWQSLYAELTNETEPDIDFELMELSARNFFLTNAPLLLSCFYYIMLQASVMHGFKRVVNAARNASDITTRRDTEDGIKQLLDAYINDLETVLKTMLDVKDSGRWPKPKKSLAAIPPLVDKVETFLKDKTRRDRDGTFHFPPISAVLKEVNSCPELLQQKRRVKKGASERRLFTARTLYSQLAADKFPIATIKQRVKNSYSAKIN